MEETKKSNYQINVNVTHYEKVILTEMISEDREINRSAFMRRLIRQEWGRRHPASEHTVENLFAHVDGEKEESEEAK